MPTKQLGFAAIKIKFLPWTVRWHDKAHGAKRNPLLRENNVRNKHYG
jgi:hypothetical protein